VDEQRRHHDREWQRPAEQRPDVELRANHETTDLHAERRDSHDRQWDADRESIVLNGASDQPEWELALAAFVVAAAARSPRRRVGLHAHAQGRRGFGSATLTLTANAQMPAPSTSTQTTQEVGVAERRRLHTDEHEDNHGRAGGAMAAALVRAVINSGSGTITINESLSDAVARAVTKQRRNHRRFGEALPIGNTGLTLTGGKLSGNGHCLGPVVKQPEGHILPGSSPGTLTLNGTTPRAQARVDDRHQRAGAGQFDILTVTGSAALTASSSSTHERFRETRADVRDPHGRLDVRYIR